LIINKNTPYYGLKLGALFGNWLYTLQALTSSNVNLVTTDIHHARNLVFNETYAPGKLNAYKFGVGYQFNDNFSVSFSYDLQNHLEARGSTTISSSVTGNVTGGCVNCAGSDNTNSTASIGISFFF
jgi:outer membrane protease